MSDLTKEDIRAGRTADIIQSEEGVRQRLVNVVMHGMTGKLELPNGRCWLEYTDEELRELVKSLPDNGQFLKRVARLANT